jgi:hypothetical protein
VNTDAAPAYSPAVQSATLLSGSRVAGVVRGGRHWLHVPRYRSAEVRNLLGEAPDGVIAVPADNPRDLTVLSDAISRPVPVYHDHRWVQTQMWGRESE